MGSAAPQASGNAAVGTIGNDDSGDRMVWQGDSSGGGSGDPSMISGTVTYNTDASADISGIATESDEDSSENMSVDTMCEVDKHILVMALYNVDVTEIFSPERVALVCKIFGLVPGSSLDLKSGWDFDLEQDRRKAEKIVREEKPDLLIGSPPCTYFSILQGLNKWLNRGNPEWLEAFEMNRQKAIRHIRFCCKLYRIQMDAGRYFLHEHPWSAGSWGLDEIEQLLSDERVDKVLGHMCQFGMESHVGKKGDGVMGPVKKPT